MKKNKANFLDFVPYHSPKITYCEKDGIITIDMYHKGFYARIAQRIFHRPSVSHIKLDTYGSFVWKNINGQNTVGDIADIIKNEFGKDIEPLYNRLIEYMRILHNNKFICYKEI
ncbi:MAG: PqqD family protein [Clostridia bacterium]|nr:PqqD family protein [Clostridia bacterium]